jgi:hypothetical protein
MQEEYLFYFIGFLGLLICGAGARLIKNSPIYKKGTKQTEGVIESYVSFSKDLYHPKVSFKAGENKIVFTSSYSSNIKPVVGKAVKVIYHPAAPENAEIKSIFSVLLPAFIALLGFCVSAACAFKILHLLKP